MTRGQWTASVSTIVILVSVFTVPACAAEVVFVLSKSVNERLCPSTDCPSTNKIYRGQRLDVYERRDGWARVSEYYDSASERAEFPQITSDRVARWVSDQYIGPEEPAPVEQPKLGPELTDARIQGIPNIGDYGLDERDVVILRKYSLQLINSGTCTGIQYGDKSVNAAGRYYVVCDGEVANRSFTEGDIR